MSTSVLFRRLSAKEAAEFQEWTREEFSRQSPEGEYCVSTLWHPVVRKEFARLIHEEAERDDG